MQTTIFSVTLEELQRIDPRFTQAFFTDLLSSLPQYGKANERHFLINTNLTLNSGPDMQFMQIFNTFVTQAAQRAPVLQITFKNPIVDGNEQ